MFSERPRFSSFPLRKWDWEEIFFFLIYLLCIRELSCEEKPETCSLPPIGDNAVWKGWLKAMWWRFIPHKCMQLRRHFTTRGRSSYDIQLILGERKEVRLDSKELAVNKVDGGESKIATKKKVFWNLLGVEETHGCLQLGRQLLELAAVRVLQRLVILRALQLHMPAENQCCWLDLLTNGGVWSGIFNWRRERERSDES